MTLTPALALVVGWLMLSACAPLPDLPAAAGAVAVMTALQGDAWHIPLADGTFVEKRHHGLQRISKL